MSNCPTPLPSNTKEELQKTFGNNYKNLISGIENNLTKCPLNGGKKNRKSKNRRTKKNQKGGNIITAQRFKQIANAIFIAILSYMLFSNSTAMQTIILGLVAVFTGQCGGSNYLWERIGLGNPVCTTYNHIIRLIMNTIAGDPVAIATLLALVTITLKSPFLINDTLKIARYQMAKTLPRQLMAPNQLELLRREAYDAANSSEIQNATTSEEQRQITDAVPAQPENQRDENVDSATMNAAQALMGLRGSVGGKRRKSRKIKKSKKSRKSKKANKSKKSKKTKKSKKSRK